MKVEVYKRVDGRWEWRAIANNGAVVATSGSQGYERHLDAINGARSARDALMSEYPAEFRGEAAGVIGDDD